MTIGDDVKTVRDSLNYAADGEPDEVAIAAFLRISQALEEREKQVDALKWALDLLARTVLSPKDTG